VRKTGHIVGVSLTGAMMIILVSYTAYVTKKRRGHLATWRKYGPLLFAVLAAVLIILDPIRHVLMDHTTAGADGHPYLGNVDVWFLREYRPGCAAETPVCFALGGWLFTFGTTYLGFICLITSTLWLVDIREKIQEIKYRWREIRMEKV